MDYIICKFCEKNEAADSLELIGIEGEIIMPVCDKCKILTEKMTVCQCSHCGNIWLEKKSCLINNEVRIYFRCDLCKKHKK